MPPFWEAAGRVRPNYLDSNLRKCPKHSTEKLAETVIVGAFA